MANKLTHILPITKTPVGNTLTAYNGHLTRFSSSYEIWLYTKGHLLRYGQLS